MIVLLLPDIMRDLFLMPLNCSGICEEVGVVERVHLLSSEVRRIATALKVGKEVQEKVQEDKDELKVKDNGDRSRGRTAHFIHG